MQLLFTLKIKIFLSLTINGNQINAFKKELTQLIGKVEVDSRIKEHIKLINDEEESKLLKAQKIIQRYEKDVEGLNQFIKDTRLSVKEKNKLIGNRTILIKEKTLFIIQQPFKYQQKVQLFSSKKIEFKQFFWKCVSKCQISISSFKQKFTYIYLKFSIINLYKLAAYKKPKFYNTSLLNKQPIYKKPSPSRPLQYYRRIPNRISHIIQQKSSLGRNNIFKQLATEGQNYLQNKAPQQQQVIQRTNQSVNNYKQLIKQVHQYECHGFGQQNKQFKKYIIKSIKMSEQQYINKNNNKQKQNQ